ncbi:MAG: hypothetical protein V4663_13425 [Bacteroidota bacterium]
MRLTREKKNAELQKHLTLVHATFDYLTIQFGRILVCDDVPSNEVMYTNQKARAEIYFKERRLDKLQKQLKGETEWLMITFDLEFENYIKKNTAYELDLFAEARSRTEEVLKKGKIEDNKDSHYVAIMTNLYEKTAGDPQKIKSLQFLQKIFYEGKGKPHSVSSKYTEEHTELVKRVEKDGTIEETFISTVTYWDGPKPSHFNERKEMAPDGERWFTLTECASSKDSSTTVTIAFSKMSVQTYYAVGIHPNINAFWKDNNTIVIETEKSYTTHSKYHKVESYGDVIAIEYIES